MKFFITGATGFVGAHLAEHLMTEGHEVYSLVRSLKKASNYKTLGNLIQGSLDSEKAPQWIDQLPKDLDIVIHTAGIVHGHDTDNFHKINDKATRSLFNGLAAQYKKLHFVFISSLASCGPTLSDTPLTEDHDQRPVSEYGLSKKNAETYLLTHTPKEWTLSIVRPPMVIGPRDPAVLDIFKMVKQGLIVSAGLKGKSKRYSFICVFDLVEMIKRVALTNSELDNRIFFGSYPQTISFEELVDSIRLQMKKKRVFYLGIPNSVIKVLGSLITSSSKIIPNDIRLTKDKVNELIPNAWTCSSKKSEMVLDMQYSYPLKRTIQVTYKDYIDSNLL